ncbi:MAG: hypothetical protein JXR48_12720 [Candidatus Delongbacteria bacterium]|nr:hypothetical protein [Candidatus Delongbacteria bacterium]MBN2835815.1 hypothetical protein [Candidatus Delongbacteria bacterium]
MYFKFLTLLIIACLNFLEGSSYSFGKNEFRFYPARTVYDILKTIPGYHLKTYKQTGQDIRIYKNGAVEKTISIVVDNLAIGTYNEMKLEDFSLSIIDSISICDDPLSSSGSTIKIFTKKLNSRDVCSEVSYRDAYLNHRDLDIYLAQRFSKNYKFKIYGNITDYMDNREDDDFYNYPYLRQNYNFSLRREGETINQDLKFGYFRSQRFNFAKDSTKEVDTRYNGEYTYNYILAKYNIFGGIRAEYGEFKGDSYNEETGQLIISSLEDRKRSLGLFFSNSKGLSDDLMDVSIIGSNESEFLKFNVRERLIAGLLENDKFYTAGELLLSKKLGYFILGEAVSISFSDEKYRRVSLLSKRFQADFRNEFDFFSVSVKTEYEFSYDYRELYNRDLYQDLTFDLNIDLFKHFSINSSYYKSLGEVLSLDHTDYSINSRLSWFDNFFDEELDISISLLHRYSEYLADGTNQIENNFGLKISAIIKTFEAYYSISNGYRNTYNSITEDYSFNPNYHYQTVAGHNMMGYDEIWGIRWTFWD